MSRSPISMPIVKKSSTLVNADGAVLMSLPQDVWDGSPIDLSLYGSITLFCTVAPGAGRKMQISPNWNGTTGDWFDLLVTSSAGASATVSATGRYTGAAGAWVKLTGTLTDGTFYLGAGS